MSPYLKINFIFINVYVSIYYICSPRSLKNLHQSTTHVHNSKYDLPMATLCLIFPLHVCAHKPVLKFVEKYCYFNETDDRYIDS